MQPRDLQDKLCDWTPRPIWSDRKRYRWLMVRIAVAKSVSSTAAADRLALWMHRSRLLAKCLLTFRPGRKTAGDRETRLSESVLVRHPNSHDRFRDPISRFFASPRNDAAFGDIREDMSNSYTITYYPQPNPTRASAVSRW